MNTEKHILQLDGLRFFAVLAVMIAHWLQWQWSNIILAKAPFVHGVILFFVLSGFLITRILLDNKEKYIAAGLKIRFLIRQFYIRRFLRIFPIYYLLLFFLYFIDYKNTVDLFPWLITYTSNIYQSIYNTYVEDFNHFWSLAVEEQFYLFWPLVILMVKPAKSITVIMVTIILSLLVRSYLYFEIGHWMATSYFTLSCMHALGIGALLAYLTMYKMNIVEKLSNPVWLYLSIGLYTIHFIIKNKYELNAYSEIFDEFFFAMVSALIILRALKNNFKGLLKYILESKFVVYSGKISYGLYVYHMFMPTFFYYLAPKIGLSINNKYTAFIAFYFLTFIVAHVSWMLIERPLNSLKSKVPYLSQVNR